MNRIVKITAIMMTMALSSCGTCVITTSSIPVLEPIQKVRFNKDELNCLGKPMKKVVIDRILNCEERLDTINNQIKAYNND